MLAFVMIYSVLYCRWLEDNKVAIKLNELKGKKHVNQRKQVSITSHHTIKSLTQMQKLHLSFHFNFLSKSIKSFICL